MWECSLSRGSAALYSSPLLLCKAWVHKQHPVPLLGPFVGGVCRNAALLCFIYDKICRFNFAVVRVWICDSFFLVCSAKSSGSLTPSTLADVFRCYVLCGLSELNILFWAFRDSVEPTDFSLPSFNQVFFSVEGVGGRRGRAGRAVVQISPFSLIRDATWLTSGFSTEAAGAQSVSLCCG